MIFSHQLQKYINYAVFNYFCEQKASLIHLIMKFKV